MPFFHFRPNQGRTRVTTMCMVVCLVMFSSSCAFGTDEAERKIGHVEVSSVKNEVHGSSGANEKEVVHHVISSDVNQEALELDDIKMDSSGNLDIEESMRLEFLSKIEIEKDHLRGNNLSIDDAKRVFERMEKLRQEYQMMEEFPEPPTAAERFDLLIEGFQGDQRVAFDQCVLSYESAAAQSTGVTQIVDNMAADCDLGLESSMTYPAPHCSQGGAYLKLLAKILSTDVTSSGQRLCAAILDEVVPLEEEPECMQVIDIIMASFLEMTGETVAWPGIVSRSEFPAAFLETCNIRGTDTSMCNEQLTTVLKITTDNGLDVFFDEFCDAVATPLTASDLHIADNKHTSRGRFLSLLKRAAMRTAKRGSSQSDSNEKLDHSSSGTTKGISTVGDDCCWNTECGAMEYCDGGKDECYRNSGEFSRCMCTVGMNEEQKKDLLREGVKDYANGKCEMKSEHVCETEKARTIEQDFSASWTVAEIGYVWTKGYGWVSTDANHLCKYAAAEFESICASAQLPDPTDLLPSLSYGMVWGEYNEFSNIAGSSIVTGTSGCLLLCAEGGLIWDLNAKEIGNYFGFRVGFSIGIDFSKAYCYTTGPADWTDDGVTIGKVQTQAEPCFSSHMTMKLEAGNNVFLNELKVGDMVQTIKDNGDVTFEPFLGFFHLHHTKSAEFLQVFHGGDAEHVLEVTKRHLVYVKTPNGFRAIAAGDLEPGMILIVTSDSADGSKTLESRIDNIGKVIRAGVYAPLTYSSKMVVGNALVSSYTVLPGLEMGIWYMAAAHAFTFPFRMTRWAMISCGITWEDPEKEVLDLLKLWMFVSKTIPKSISSLHESAAYMLQQQS